MGIAGIGGDCGNWWGLWELMGMKKGEDTSGFLEVSWVIIVVTPWRDEGK